MLIPLAGESVRLLPERALYWPARQMLIVADIHFGKAATFRARGIPVPRGTTSQNLALLDALVEQFGVQHIVFLGDFLHAREAHATATLASIRQWRAGRPALQLTLIRGNHDSHAGDPPPDLAIDIVDEPYRCGAFAFCHHPQQCDGAYVLAGHLHPVFMLAAGGDAARLPCFVLGEESGILPAFGAFTGGMPVRSHAGTRIYLVADDAVFALP